MHDFQKGSLFGAVSGLLYSYFQLKIKYHCPKRIQATPLNPLWIPFAIKKLNFMELLSLTLRPHPQMQHVGGLNFWHF
jgi:hypothetical protein